MLLAAASGTSQAKLPPTCRLDSQAEKMVETTLRLAVKAYNHLGKHLPFDQITVNPESRDGNPRTLAVYVVSDASVSTVNKAGCIVREPSLVKGEELDAISVRGGCIAVAGSQPEIRCSAEAVNLFGYKGSRKEGANPAFLYVLAHELGHIFQRRQGEYAGRVEHIKLKQSKEAKLEILRESCEPGLTSVEEEADQLAIQVLANLLPAPPYKEPMFSTHGSVLWGVNQINLAANNWRKVALEREFISQEKPHRSFMPTEFPTPMPKIAANAKRFVCDVLTRNTGTVLYPGRAITHPPLELRMQRVAEALRLVAAGLPRTDGHQDYRPITVVQEQLSDIFTFIYRENGVYFDAVQDAICTRVNSDAPTAGCAAKPSSRSIE